MDSGVVFKLYSAVKSYLVFRIALLSVKLVETLFNLARAEQMQFKTYKIMLCTYVQKQKTKIKLE